jgi:hypothetical protein
MRFYSILAIFMLAAVGNTHALQQSGNTDAMPEILKALNGNWLMTRRQRHACHLYKSR